MRLAKAACANGAVPEGLSMPSSVRFLDATGQLVVTFVESDAVSSDFGLHVWPCGLVLAHYLWAHRDELLAAAVRPRCLELGCGIGVPVSS